MAEPTQPEQGIQAGAPPAPPLAKGGLEGVAPATAIQEGTTSPDPITLPPLPPAPEPTPVATGWTTFDVVLLLLLATLSVFLGSFVVTNSDFWLHLATGRAIATGAHTFGVDPFSLGSVHNGVPVRWINHAWLYDLGQFGVYSAFGGRGVVIVQAMLMAALFLLIVKVGSGAGSPMTALLLAGLTVLVVSQRVSSTSSALATPMMASFVLFGAMFVLLRRGGALAAVADDEQASARALWGVPLLFVLWVNLDAWFILGLATLALVVLGNAVGCALGWQRRCSVGTQAFVLLVSVAACLLNPYHVHAFTLPAELGHALPWLPTSLCPGAEALRGLAKYDPELLTGVGYVWPLHANYNPFLGQNFSIARVAYFLLLVLSIVSFLLAAASATGAGGAGLPIGRALAWLFVAFLGGTQILLIPLFAVVAGPITIVNFVEFGQWRRQRALGGPELILINPNLARFAVAVLALVALGLAWPGWLHSAIGEPSTRRVAWQVQADPSLRASAEALKQAGAKHVFNLSSDIAHYCAWFAPGVRCYIDQRLGLFAHEAAQYAKMRKQLREDANTVIRDQRRPPKSDWPELFRAQQIDHLVITRFWEQPHANAVVMMCWLQPWHWTQRYADGRTLVFAWSATGQGAGESLHAAFNRAAFGPVPAERRAPLGGANPPQTSSLQSIYLDGQAAFAPLTASEPNVHLVYYNLVKERWRLAYEPLWHIAVWAGPAGLGSAAPGSCLGLFTDVYTQWMDRLIFPKLRLPPDFGPPAAPLLMIRAARQALADNPNEAAPYLALYDAYKLQSAFLEEAWSSGTGMPPDRVDVRQVQMVTALRNYLDLKPDDWRVRHEFARLFYSLHHFDAGLEQMTLVLEKLAKERRKARDKRNHDALLALEKDLTEFHKNIERDVKRRRGDYDLMTAKKEPMQKFQVAVLIPYDSFDKENKPVRDPGGMGLSLEGLKQLQSISPDSLPAADKSMLHYFRCRVLLQLGRLGEASNELFEVKDAPVQQTLLWHFAALGAYELMDSTLARLEDQAEQELPLAPASRNLAVSLAAAQRLHMIGEQPTLPRIFSYLNRYSMPGLAEITMAVRQALEKRADLRTLRGMLALEVGDTARAEEHLAQALKIAGKGVYFPDRPIAERYLELIRAEKK